MSKAMFFLGVFFVLSSCDSHDKPELTMMAEYEYTIEQLILSANFNVNISSEYDKERLVFYVSDSQCLDCILKNMKLLSNSITNREIDIGQLLIIANYSDQRMLKSQLIRSKLNDVELIEKDGKLLFQNLENIYDLPTLFIYNPRLEIGHSMFQATLGKEHLSSLLIKIYSQRL